MNKPTLIFRNLLGRKNRFAFTLSGITMGIIALVVLISLGAGLQAQIHQQARDLGANMIVTAKGWCAYEQVKVLSGAQLPDAILPEDLEKIEAIEGITVQPYLTLGSAINNEPVSVSGVRITQLKDIRKWSVQEGSFPDPIEQKYGIVAGHAIADSFDLSINQTIRLRGHEFTITGIMEQHGTADDGILFIDLQAAMEVYETQGRVSYIAVQVDDINRIEYYSRLITDTANVAVISDQQLLNSVLSVVNTVGTTLKIIAIIAILAASFGIINTMITAIYERKRDIGILKSVGSSNQTIFQIFLGESALYGLIGGVIGLIVGNGISYVITPLIAQNEFTAFVRASSVSGTIAWQDMGLILLGSILISAISGIYPAYKAAKLTPVEAISYE
jgi:putative ABC transport system permease protein